jgi:predicted ATPase
MESIEISAYKSIKNLKLELLPINILIGANGAGKSNILSFFEFLDHLYNQKLQEYVGLRGGIRKFIYNGDQSIDKIAAKIAFDGNINSYSFEIKPSANTFVLSQEILCFKNQDWSLAPFTSESSLKSNNEDQAKQIQKHLKSLRKYHFHDTGASSPFNQSSKIGKDGVELYDCGENLAAFLYEIKTNHFKVYNRIIKTIQSVLPYFSDFVLNPDSANNIALYWQNKHGNYNYDITDFSDGSIRFIALVVLFMQPNPPRTIIIDEPELGLHPFAIAKLAGLIKAVSSETCQVIIATQSADLIAHFNPSDVIAVDNINGETKIERLDNVRYKGWLEDYTLDELWKRNIINLAQPNI